MKNSINQERFDYNISTQFRYKVEPSPSKQIEGYKMFSSPVMFQL